MWALSFLSSNKRITINKVSITGTHIIDQEEIEFEVLSDMSGKYFHLFTKANSFIYPHKKIYNNLRLNFPRIETLSIYRDNLKTLHIGITERAGSFLYCGATIPEMKDQIGENCYFINNDGYIFDKAPYFSGNVYFKYYLALDFGGDDPLGDQMLGADQFHRIARFIDGVTLIGFNPIYITEEPGGTNSLYLNHGGNDTVPKITFKNSDNLDVLLDNLSLAMKKKEFADEVNSKYNTLLYIDLRFKNKVLYKFQ